MHFCPLRKITQAAISFLNIPNRVKKKEPPFQHEDCEALCLKFQFLDWMTQQ